jgi:hypothetical protein
MKKLVGLGTGCALAVLGALGLGSVAGASTVAVPIPGVGQVGVVSQSGSSGTVDCLAAQLNSAPSQPIGVCAFDATTPFGQNVTGIAVMEGGTTTDILLNPLGIQTS